MRRPCHRSTTSGASTPRMAVPLSPLHPARSTRRSTATLGRAELMLLQRRTVSYPPIGFYHTLSPERPLTHCTLMGMPLVVLCQRGSEKPSFVESPDEGALGTHGQHVWSASAVESSECLRRNSLPFTERSVFSLIRSSFTQSCLKACEQLHNEDGCELAVPARDSPRT